MVLSTQPQYLSITVVIWPLNKFMSFPYHEITYFPRLYKLVRE